MTKDDAPVLWRMMYVRVGHRFVWDWRGIFKFRGKEPLGAALR